MVRTELQTLITLWRNFNDQPGFSMEIKLSFPGGEVGSTMGLIKKLHVKTGNKAYADTSYYSQIELSSIPTKNIIVTVQGREIKDWLSRFSERYINQGLYPVPYEEGEKGTMAWTNYLGLSASNFEGRCNRLNILVYKGTQAMCINEAKNQKVNSLEFIRVNEKIDECMLLAGLDSKGSWYYFIDHYDKEEGTVLISNYK